jgi:choline-sulfatase
VPDWIHSGLPKHDLESAKNVMASYYACVSQVDDMVGRIVKALEQQGMKENTVIIYTTDHGEHLFEHGLRGKHNMLEASLKIPFIISYPKRLGQGQTNDSLVSLIDLIPSFCEIMGWDKPNSATGQSFISILERQQNLKSRTLFAEYRSGNYKAFPKQKDLPSRMLRRGDYKYIYTHGIVDQLYNVVKDPDELNNLAMNPEYQNLLKQKNLETLAHWRFERYRPMNIHQDGEHITWESHPNCIHYNVYHSTTGTLQDARLISKETPATSLAPGLPGVYWVQGNFNFTRTTARFKNTPVLISEHTFILPITEGISFNSEIIK